RLYPPGSFRISSVALGVIVPIPTRPLVFCGIRKIFPVDVPPIVRFCILTVWIWLFAASREIALAAAFCAEIEATVALDATFKTAKCAEEVEVPPTIRSILVYVVFSIPLARFQ